MDTGYLQSVLSLGGLLVAIGGFLLVFYQLRQVERSIRSSTQASVYSHSNFVREVLLDAPLLRKYFYANCSADGLDRESADYQRVLLIAEVYANYLEHIVVQRPSLPKQDWTAWATWVRTMYGSSPVLRDLISNSSLYSQDLKDLLMQHSEEQGG